MAFIWYSWKNPELCLANSDDERELHINVDFKQLDTMRWIRLGPNNDDGTVINMIYLLFNAIHMNSIFAEFNFRWLDDIEFVTYSMHLVLFFREAVCSGLSK